MAVPDTHDVSDAHQASPVPVRSWWSQRFVGLLESFGLGSRLERGREYARAGHVLELDVEPGIVLARVQGSRFSPYRVRIRPQPFSDHQWRRAEKAIAARALTLARLLAGEMPDDIEEVLAGGRLALLPASYEELRASCTCPDGADPCKHTAAVYYKLAEHFDAEPFALFTLRGRTEDELLEALRKRRARAAGVSARSGAGAAAEPQPSSGWPLAESVDDFWSAGPELTRLEVSPLAAEQPDALLRRLGSLGSGGDGGLDLGALLAPAYAHLAAAAERRGLAE
ncbi:MAG: SWIM zinc finger family protein [Solirubrobacteraceae bacterium]